MASHHNSHQSQQQSPYTGPDPPPAYDYVPVVRVHQIRSVVVTQPVAVVAFRKSFPETPVTVRCPGCGAGVVSLTRFQAGSATCIVCCALCLVVGVFGIFVCVGDCTKDVIHVCPNCNSELGRFYRV